MRILNQYLRQGGTTEKNIDIAKAFLYNNEIMKVPLFYENIS